MVGGRTALAGRVVEWWMCDREVADSNLTHMATVYQCQFAFCFAHISSLCSWWLRFLCRSWFLVLSVSVK